MPARKRTPDILSDLLRDGEPAKRLDVNPDKQNTGIPANHNDVKAEKQDAGMTEYRPESPEKHKAKATYYLSRQALDVLDELHYTLRKMAKSENRARISRSAIVEHALLSLEEALKTGDEEALITQIVSSQHSDKPA